MTLHKYVFLGRLVGSSVGTAQMMYESYSVMSHSCTQRSLVAESTEVEEEEEEECICCLYACLLVGVGGGGCRDRQNYAAYHFDVSIV